MAVNYNPSIVNSGLVFCYDMGNVKKSWIGAPVTNMQWNNGAEITPWTVNGINTDVTSTIEDAPVPTAKTWKFVKTGTSSQWNGWESSYGGIWTGTSGDIWTTSYWYKTLEPAGATEFGVGNFYTPDWSRAYNVTILENRSSIIADGQWRFNYTVSRFNENYTNAITVDGPSWGYSTSAGVLYVNGLQWNKNSYAAPFAAGTRSNTQSILDITRNHTITATSLSYANNNIFSFSENGSSRLDTNIPITSIPALSNWTLEAWVKCTSFPTASTPNQYGVTYKAGVLFGATYYSGAAIYWYGNSSGNACTMYGYIRGADSYRNTAGYNLTLNTPTHLVCVHDYSANKLRLYVNGSLYSEVQGATQEYNPALTPDAGNIGVSKPQVDGGGTANYSHFNGEVPIAKIYNRALSAQEILQNFNAIRGRFGI